MRAMSPREWTTLVAYFHDFDGNPIQSAGDQPFGIVVSSWRPPGLSLFRSHRAGTLNGIGSVVCRALECRCGWF